MTENKFKCKNEKKNVLQNFCFKKDFDNRFFEESIIFCGYLLSFWVLRRPRCNSETLANLLQKEELFNVVKVEGILKKKYYYISGVNELNYLFKPVLHTYSTNQNM